MEEAQRHVVSSGQSLDHLESQKLQAIARCLSRIAGSRRIGDWKNALKETDTAISSGADASSLVKSISNCLGEM